MKTQPIRVGDKFKPPKSDNIYTVIKVFPGGMLDLFIKEKTWFTKMRHSEVKTWERIA